MESFKVTIGSETVHLAMANDTSGVACITVNGKPAIVALQFVDRPEEGGGVLRPSGRTSMLTFKVHSHGYLKVPGSDWRTEVITWKPRTSAKPVQVASAPAAKLSTSDLEALIAELAARKLAEAPNMTKAIPVQPTVKASTKRGRLVGKA